VNYDKNANFQHRFSQNYKNATYAPLLLDYGYHITCILPFGF